MRTPTFGLRWIICVEELYTPGFSVLLQGLKILQRFGSIKKPSGSDPRLQRPQEATQNTMTISVLFVVRFIKNNSVFSFFLFLNQRIINMLEPSVSSTLMIYHTGRKTRRNTCKHQNQPWSSSQRCIQEQNADSASILRHDCTESLFVSVLTKIYTCQTFSAPLFQHGRHSQLTEIHGKKI